MRPQVQCACGKLQQCYSTVPCTNLATPPTAPFLGRSKITTVDEMFKLLLKCGGVIVMASACSAYEIQQAQVEGRVYTDAQGVGFVLLTQDWLDDMRVLERANAAITSAD